MCLETPCARLFGAFFAAPVLRTRSHSRSPLIFQRIFCHAALKILAVGYHSCAFSLNKTKIFCVRFGFAKMQRIARDSSFAAETFGQSPCMAKNPLEIYASDYENRF